MTIEEKYRSWISCPVMTDELLSILSTMDEATVHDSFYRDLEFGTGGLRGVLGPGTNRMNVFTVIRATRGLGKYLKAAFSDPSCAVSFDSRIHSRDFAELTSAVLADMGIRVYLYPHLQPTPMLSFAVRHLRTSAGVMITASHNPARFNGYKVYGPDGCQITLEAAAEILKHISAEPDLADRIPTLKDGLSSGKISYITDETIESYYQAIMKLRIRPVSEPLRVVYSPLNGTGNVPVREMLRRMKTIQVDVVPEQELPDGNFPTCPYPNPEIREAMRLAIDQTVRSDADICFATDPDCDRMGAGVRVGNEVRLITGNEMGILFLDYLCRNTEPAVLSGKVAVKTIVSTDMAVPLCRKYGVELRNVLTGFKFIGEQIGFLEKDRCADRFLFGFEESYGYLSGTDVRDKDAVNAAVLLMDMAAQLKSEGKTLLDRLAELRDEYGYYAQRLLTFEYEGDNGAARMRAIMANLRKPLSEFSDMMLRTSERTDYLHDSTGLPQSDVIEFRIPGNRKVIVRPSGTEPKMKAYLFAVGSSQAAAENELDPLEKTVRELCG